jgi:hypothetical protein
MIASLPLSDTKKAKLSGDCSWRVTVNTQFAEPQRM